MESGYCSSSSPPHRKGAISEEKYTRITMRKTQLLRIVMAKKRVLQDSFINLCSVTCRVVLLRFLTPKRGRISRQRSVQCSANDSFYSSAVIPMHGASFYVGRIQMFLRVRTIVSLTILRVFQQKSGIYAAFLLGFFLEIRLITRIVCLTYYCPFVKIP